MSLNSKIAKIARETIQGYVNSQTTFTQNNTTKSTTNLVGQITNFDQGSMLFTVVFADGTTQTAAPGGLRPLGVGDCVIVSNGAIIG